MIEKIFKGETIVSSLKLLKWIEQSDENRAEYIRYKNLWALIQDGKNMNISQVNKDFEIVKSKIRKTNKTLILYQVLKYVAIVFFGILSGYLLTNHIIKEEITLTEISVPKGNRSEILLPDGSRVWLTNGSKLIYPNRFSKRKREIELIGEAYFTVSHNKKKPLIVNIGSHNIRVLGTEFSVLAYPSDSLIQIDLVSGEIEFGFKQTKFITLEPSYSLILDKTSGELTRSKIKGNFFKYWQKGIYNFEKESFSALSEKINRIFGVELIFEDENIKHHSFTGTFNIDDNIYTMMEVIRHASGEAFDYRVERNKIFLKSLKQ